MFSDANMTRVAVIVRSKAAGMSLEYIQAMLDGKAVDRRQVLTAHIQDLGQRMAEIARSRKMTLQALDCRPTTSP
jgi:DNA-binding transcriptional MerR regulator